MAGGRAADDAGMMLLLALLAVLRGTCVQVGAFRSPLGSATDAQYAESAEACCQCKVTLSSSLCAGHRGWVSAPSALLHKREGPQVAVCSNMHCSNIHCLLDVPSWLRKHGARRRRLRERRACQKARRLQTHAPPAPWAASSSARSSHGRPPAGTAPTRRPRRCNGCPGRRCCRACQVPRALRPQPCLP